MQYILVARHRTSHVNKIAVPEIRSLLFAAHLDPSPVPSATAVSRIQVRRSHGGRPVLPSDPIVSVKSITRLGLLSRRLGLSRTQSRRCGTAPAVRSPSPENRPLALERPPKVRRRAVSRVAETHWANAGEPSRTKAARGTGYGADKGRYRAMEALSFDSSLLQMYETFQQVASLEGKKNLVSICR